ncbi:MAG: inositol monophosphatase family protein [Thermomicrobiales bacterium]
MKYFPGDALLTEEGVDDVASANRRVWIVDPIDSTQQFIDRTGEFDVVIALAVDGKPVVGVLYQPTEDQTLILVGGGAWVRRGDDGDIPVFGSVRPDADLHLCLFRCAGIAAAAW